MSECADVWKDMEATRHPGSTGFLRRRIRPDSNRDIFLGLEKPADHRMLLLHLTQAVADTVRAPATTRNIELLIHRDVGDGEAVLELRLVDRAYQEIFSILADDLINVLVTARTEVSAVEAFIARFERWQQFFTRSGPAGLGEEAQRGLYGELWFIGNCLMETLDHLSAVSAWTGYGRTAQDFQLGDVAVEVKATTAKQPQHLSIASERQLDDTGVDALFLFHLSLDVRQGDDRTLPLLVDTLRAALGEHTVARGHFEESLLMAGFIDAHRARYDHTAYTVRQASVFHVRDDFPRLVESGLPGGVGNVRYSVAVSECSRFTVDTEFFVQALARGSHVR